ncbi:hypothetical protein CKAH01_04796 [Colletotrichum kahawae]|uniref:Uncharacterized protein n=1 Tax=Colletotrichum kahawae TaxID=34407 RepID=A0AAE0D7B4_COLKA|nr:hypothetical protein CKAH01_04796 [Colletotrichum kahawae]
MNSFSTALTIRASNSGRPSLASTSEAVIKSCPLMDFISASRSGRTICSFPAVQA